MNTACSVLVVERDPSTAAAVESALLRQGLQAVHARDGSAATAALRTRELSLIILDPALAPDNGWAIFRRLRRSPLPIIVLVPSGDPVVTRLAQTLGADDCVAGSGAAEEAATRARLVLRQATAPAPRPTAHGDIALDPNLSGARVGDRQVALTPSEYGLLEALIDARGKVVTREQLVIRARASAGALPLVRSVEAHVRSLRQKLQVNGEPPRLVTVRGFGYRLEAGPSRPAPDLAEAIVAALPESIFVLDERRHVRFMNPAAEQLVGKTAAVLAEQPTCARLLGCRMTEPDCGTCPWLATHARGAPSSTCLVIYPRDEPVAVEGTATELLDKPGHMLLRLRRE